jgi:hypothetical protein
MPFFALRIVCDRCGAAFLIGGSAANDLAHWRRLTVECRSCHAPTPATNGHAVNLTRVRSDGDLEAFPVALSHPVSASVRLM